MPKNSTFIADFEAHNSLLVDQDNNQGKTIDIFKQIPVCNRFNIINKLNDLPVRMGYYKSPLGQNDSKRLLKEIENNENQLTS